MIKRNKSIRIFAAIFLFMSFLFAPVNLVMAYEASAEKTASDSYAASDSYKDADKDTDKKKAEEEPDCE